MQDCRARRALDQTIFLVADRFQIGQAIFYADRGRGRFGYDSGLRGFCSIHKPISYTAIRTLLAPLPSYSS
jgi:hypothetical protein